MNYTLGLSNTGTAGNPVRLQHNADGSYVIRPDQAEADELLKDLGLQRHIIKGNIVWDLPDVSGADGGMRVIAAIVNDWQLSGILTAGSGAPYSVGFSYSGGAVGNGNQNLTGSPSYAPRILITGDPGSGCSDNQYAQFNTSAFSVPVASASNPSLGLESGQNYLHGCFDKTIDLALARNFRIGWQPDPPVPTGSVQRVQHGRVQRPQHHAAGHEPRQLDAEQPSVRCRGQPGADAPPAAERRIRRGHGRTGHAVDAGADPLPVLSGKRLREAVIRGHSASSVPGTLGGSRHPATSAVSFTTSGVRPGSDPKVRR